MLTYKAGATNTKEENNKIIESNKIDIKNDQVKIDTLKKYADYQDVAKLEQKIKDYKINAGKLWNDSKVAEDNYEWYDGYGYYTDKSDLESYDYYNFLKNSDCITVYDSNNYTTRYIYSTTLYYNNNDYFSDGKTSRSVYQTYYYIGDDLYTDKALETLNYSTIDYSYEKPHVYYTYNGVSDRSSTETPAARYEYLKGLYNDNNFSANVLAALDMVYDFYVNCSAYADTMATKVKDYNDAVDSNYKYKDNAFTKLRNACNSYYWNNYYLTICQTALYKADDIQNLIDDIQAEINAKTAQNEMLTAVNNGTLDAYDTNVAYYEAVIASCNVLVEAAEKELEMKKAMYEAYLKSVSAVENK